MRMNATFTHIPLPDTEEYRLAERYERANFVI